MAFALPTAEQLKEIGAELGIPTDDAYIAAVRAYIAPFVDAYELVGHIPSELPEVRYPRTPGYRPEGEENKYAAWIVKTSIKGAARGPLKGKKVAIKDTVCIAGVPLANGTSVLDGYVPEIDATIVTRLLDAGAEIVGKTVCEYFSFSGGSATSASGPVINPRAPGHTPGGSSTGSAAVVAAGEVDMAIGGDQAGSIRIPSSFTGVVGMKATHGLVPYTGIMGMDATIDHAGPITATVEANAPYLEVLAGADGLDPRQRDLKLARYTKALGQNAKGLKIAVVKEGFGHFNSEADTDAGVRAAAKHFETIGAKVDEVSIAWHLFGVPIWGPICLEGGYHTMYSGNGIGRNIEGLYPLSLARALAGFRERSIELPHTVKFAMLLARFSDKHHAGIYYAKAQNLRRRLRAAYDAVLANYDVLLLPTTPMMTDPIPPAGAPLETVMNHCWQAITNTCPFNVTGHPAISLPCGFGKGDRPIGLMLVGKHFDETTLYRAAHAFERSGDWQQMGPARRGAKPAKAKKRR